MLELLLGLSLVCITLLVLFGLFPMGERSVAQADRASQAAAIARSMMERALAQHYDSLLVDPATYAEGDDLVYHTRRHGHELSTSFHYRVEITQPDPAREVKRILVRVSWRQGTGKSREETVAVQSSKGKLW
jgi:hypothetical protein